MREGCAGVCELLDSYLCDELPVETRQVLASHLAGCTACASELERRGRLRAELRNALRGAPPSPELEGRIRRAVEAAAPGRALRPRLVLGLAASVMVALTGALLLRRRIPGVPETPSPAVAQIEARGLMLAKLGLYDAASLIHQACGVQRKYSGPPSLEVAAARLGPHALIWAALQPELSDATLVDTHICPPRASRQYGHVVLRRDSRVLSILVTRLQPGDDLSVKAQAVRIPGVEARAFEVEREGYEIEALEAGGRLGFLVSETGQADDSAFLRRVLPRLARVLKLDAQESSGS